jgi:hypothetical protein
MGGEQSPPKALPVIRDFVTAEEFNNRNQVLNNFNAKLARANAIAYVEGSRAQGPSRKQVGYLAHLLGNPGREAIVAFVRYANGYLPYCEVLTRVHFIEAINLAVHGRNSWGSHRSLIELAELDGPLWTGEGDSGARSSFRHVKTSKDKRRNPA